MLDDFSAPQSWDCQWFFPPQVVYLNHGSFGPSPSVVQRERQKWLQHMEANPMQFYTRQLALELERVQERLGQFLHCHGRDIALVENTTSAMNILARSLPLEPGDRVVMTDQAYGAVLRLFGQVCQQRGAELVVAPVRFPVESPDQLAQTVLDRVDQRTRLVVVDHVSSASALVFPVEKICRELRDHRAWVVVDGAHGLVMRPVDLESLGCDFYVASCHKWLSAPFCCGFLWAHPRWHSLMRPAVVSWGRTFPGNISGWVDEFHWRGTYDPSPMLSIPEALKFVEQVGVDRLREHGHKLVQKAQEALCALPGVEPLYPAHWNLCGTMLTVRLPSRHDALALQHRLAQQHQVEVIVPNWITETWLRVSCYLYNRPEHIQRLVDAVRKELGL